MNKTNNCVQLRHKPSNVIVKCHKHRSACSNRKEARKMLLGMLDDKLNGKDSVTNQLKEIGAKKNAETLNKRKKLSELKEKWKERENIKNE